jgi:hypothetical protein
MVMMEITRQVTTNVPVPSEEGAPMNQITHLRAFPDHTFRKVVRPNADTLYSMLWFDVSEEPLVISVPDTTGRYFLLPMLDMWTDVFAVPGSRTSGTKAMNFAIIGPEWNGPLPKDVEPIRSPTNIGWVIGRTQTNGVEDYENVHRVQDDIKVTPLNQWGKPYTLPKDSPVISSIDMKIPPPVQVFEMNAKTYFELFAELLKNNSPHENDWPILTQLRWIGIVPGEDLDFSKLPPQTQEVLERAVKDAQKIIIDRIESLGEGVNGWRILRGGIGTYGTSYLQRASTALFGLGANVPEDSIYPISFTDSNGDPYNGSQRYILHFNKNEIPPVHAFWSLAMYDNEMYFTDNPINRYSIGDRDDLQFNNDGSLDIYIQHESPGAHKESNWLPAPEGVFDLVLRVYWPKIEALTGGWNPPAVKQMK